MISAAPSLKGSGRPVAFGRSAAVILSLFVMATPALAQPRVNQEPPQRGGAPRPETPYIVIATFRSDDRKLGVEAADEVRKRVSSEHSAQELFVVTKRNIEATLSASGYRPDSALSASDLYELSKQLHGEYILDAEATKSGGGVRITPRLMLKTGTTPLSQPLPVANGKDAGDAAKMVEKSITDAIKGIAPYKLCITDLRAQKWAEAAKNAAAGIAAYPNSTLSRVCLLSAVTGSKGSPDSVIAVASGILALDSTSTLALSNLFDARVQKNDTKGALDVGTRLLATDPNNRELAKRLVQMYVTDNQPDKALALIETLLKDNPGDVELVATKWKVLLAAGRWKEAIAVGEELAKLDPSQVTVEYYNRMIGAAQKGDSASVLRFAEAASAKFPKDISFINLVTAGYAKSGQLPKALEWGRKASQIDPKDPTPWQFILAIQNQMHQPDSMVASAREAAKAGVPKDSLSSALVGVVGPAINKATASHDRADWQAALSTAQVVDEIVGTAQTKYFVGVSAYSIMGDAAQNVQKLYNSGKPAKGTTPKMCEEIKVIDDYSAIAATNLQAGGRFDPKTAGELLSNLPAITQFASQLKTALKCK